MQRGTLLRARQVGRDERRAGRGDACGAFPLCAARRPALLRRVACSGLTAPPDDDAGNTLLLRISWTALHAAQAGENAFHTAHTGALALPRPTLRAARRRA